MHFLYIYNKELIRDLEGTRNAPGRTRCIFCIYFDKDLIRKLEGMHQEDPGAFSIYLQRGFNKET